MGISNYIVDEFRNILALIVLELIFAMPCIQRRSRFWLRLAGGTAVSLAVVTLYVFVHAYLQRLSDTSAIMLISIAWYSGIVALTAALLLFCFAMNPTELVWIVLTAYAAQHIAYIAANECLLLGLRLQLHVGLQLLLYCAVAAGIDVCVWFVFSPRIRGREHLYGNHSWKNCLVLLVMLAVFLMSTFANQYNAVRDFQTLNLLSVASDAVNCVFVLVVQYMSLRTSQINVEKETVEKLLENEKKQYEAFRNAVDYINIKCHDLKKEIRAMAQSGTFDARYLDEIAEQVAVYESFVKTGNETLDLLLTDQNLMCLRSGIALSCMADASGLCRMEDKDIYTLFGNMLDNAVEYVRQVPAPEKRFIRLVVKPRGTMTVIHQENYFDGTLDMTGGMPPTKKDSTYHGFGMLSMQRIVTRYGGSLRVAAGDGVFRVDAIIPNA